jgi:hypothetical protein
MRSVVPLLVMMVVMGGCHQRFKKNVASLGEVRPQVLVTTGPSVLLGGAAGDGLVAAAVNITQAVKSVNTADRLAQAVDIDRVNSAFAESLVQALGAGPPFGTTPDPNASVLQVEVVSYGLEAPAMGLQGTFNYDLHVSIFKPDGSKVYNAQQGCNVPFGEASALSQALGTVNNVKQINEMTDEQIQEAFEGAAAGCGQQLVMRMRQHAG